eukprot:4368621-Pleurochrysis_carterae.AAC.1
MVHKINPDSSCSGKASIPTTSCSYCLTIITDGLSGDVAANPFRRVVCVRSVTAVLLTQCRAGACRAAKRAARVLKGAPARSQKSAPAPIPRSNHA